MRALLNPIRVTSAQIEQDNPLPDLGFSTPV
jgi:hypothetical protein